MTIFTMFLVKLFLVVINLHFCLYLCFTQLTSSKFTFFTFFTPTMFSLCTLCTILTFIFVIHLYYIISPTLLPTVIMYIPTLTCTVTFKESLYANNWKIHTLSHASLSPCTGESVFSSQGTDPLESSTKNG